jgi:hypothetical protein
MGEEDRSIRPRLAFGWLILVCVLSLAPLLGRILSRLRR